MDRFTDLAILCVLLFVLFNVGRMLSARLRTHHFETWSSLHRPGDGGPTIAASLKMARFLYSGTHRTIRDKRVTLLVVVIRVISVLVLATPIVSELIRRG